MRVALRVLSFFAAAVPFMLGLTAPLLTEREFARRIKAEIEKWAKVIRAAGACDAVGSFN